MRLVRSWRGGTLALTLVAACSGGGGELREETERRRAENAVIDTAAPDAGADSAGEFRLPTFVDTSGPAAPAADTTPAAPPAAPKGQAEWSASPREAGRAGATASILRGMRVGLNAGFDRLVLDFGDSPVPPYQIEYVDSPVRQCGSGEPVQVAGQGWLLVRLRSSQAHDDAGRATVRDRRIVPTTPVLRQVEIVCDFEGQVEVVMGVQAPNPFRVLVVPTPNRLIVDIRH
ncbi:MAG: hypothetical protein ICV87_02780 [Gemmatimonadetes bacterium]|nr:hypothetical protein [Gemmatimonadota bacterium]